MDDRIRIAIAAIALSATGLVAIAQYEGFRSKAYDDGVGIQTIGFGTTRKEDGSPVKAGDTITVERALIRLASDAGKFERTLKGCIGDVPLRQNEWDAFVSWAYNVGTAAACGSTLVKKLRVKDYSGACLELLRWTKAGGRELQGLVVRRQTEYKQCIS
jgi:lysozyme